MKRIGFLVSSQTLIPHGGIGQFTKSFCDLMDSHGIYVDIITDKSPQGVADEFVKELKANIIYPDEPQRYTDHSAIFMYEDSYCYERMANFRDAGFTGPVYFMPVGGVESVYHLNNRTVADLAMNNGVRYSDRLQVPLFKNAWAT